MNRQGRQVLGALGCPGSPRGVQGAPQDENVCARKRARPLPADNTDRGSKRAHPPPLNGQCGSIVQSRMFIVGGGATAAVAFVIYG